MSAQKTKTYEVTDVHGTVHRFDADMFFDNQGTLVFRVGERGSSEIVATFATGQWTGCVLVSRNGQSEDQAA